MFGRTATSESSCILHKAFELEKELEEKRQLTNKNDSLLQQLREEEKPELEQKHEQATNCEISNVMMNHNYGIQRQPNKM